MQSPYRCLACDARFLVVSHRARQAATVGLVVAICIAFAAFTWWSAPTSKLPNPKDISNSRTSPNSTVPAEANVTTLAKMAKESHCVTEPVNVVGETYKCATASGLTSYFIVPSAKPSAKAPISSQQSATDTLDGGGAPVQPLEPAAVSTPPDVRRK